MQFFNAIWGNAETTPTQGQAGSPQAGGVLNTDNGPKEVQPKKETGGLLGTLFNNSLVQRAVLWTFKSEDQKPCREKVENTLGPDFVKVAESFVPASEDLVKSSLEENCAFLLPLLENNKEFLREFITTAYLKLFGNVAATIQERGLASGDEGKVEFIDVLSFLFEISNRHFDVIREDYLEIEKEYQELLGQASSEEQRKELEKEQNTKLAALFEPMSEEILLIFYPNGKEDLGVGKLYSGKLWNALKTQVMPVFSETLFTLVDRTHHESDKDIKALRQPGGAALKELAPLLGKKGIELAKESLQEEKTANLLLRPYLSPNKDLADTTIRAFVKTMSRAATSSDPNIQEVFNRLETQSATLILHALTQLGLQNKEFKGNLTAKAIDALLDIFIEFFVEKNETLLQKLKEFEKISDPNDREKAQHELFKPLVEELLVKTELVDDPLVRLFGKPLLYNIAFSLHEKFIGSQSTLSDYKERMLRVMLGQTESPESVFQDNGISFEEQEISRTFEGHKESDIDLERGVPSLNLTDETEKEVDDSEITRESSSLPPASIETQENEPAQVSVLETLLNASENEESLDRYVQFSESIDGVEKSLGILAKDITDLVASTVQKNKAAIAETIAKTAGLGNKAEGELVDAIHQVLGGRVEGQENSLHYAETLIQNTLFRIFVLTAEAEGKDPDLLAAKVIHRITSRLGEQIPAVEKDVRAILAKDTLTEEEKKAEIAKLFIPVAHEILGVAGKNADGSLKIWSSVGIAKEWEPLVEAQVEQILPQFLSQLYMDMTSWVRSGSKVEPALEDVVSNAPTVTKKLTDFIEAFIPLYVKQNAKQINKLVMNNANKYFAYLSPDERARLSSLIERNIVAVSQEEGMNPAYQAVAAYAKGFVTNVLGQGLINLNDAESKEKVRDLKTGDTILNPFLLNMFIAAMSESSDHFKKISSLQTAGKPSYALDHQELLKEFNKSGLLHQALAFDLDSTKTESEKRQQRLEKFFKPLAADLLAIGGKTSVPDDFPVSGLLDKEEVWATFKDKMLPEMLMGLYDELLKPSNIHKVMGNVIDSLSETLNKIDENEEEEEEAALPTSLNPAQRALNEEAGKLIHNIVGMFPVSATKFLFSVGKINKMSAETLGAKILEQTNSNSLADLVNHLLAGVEFSLPSDPPKTEAEIKKEEKALSQEVKDKMKNLISSEAKKQTRNFVKNTLKSWNNSIESAVEKYFGKPGLAVKNFFGSILSSISSFIMPVLNFIVFKCLWVIVDWYIGFRVSEVMKDTSMPIHENLAFRMTERIVKQMRAEVDATQKAKEESLRAEKKRKIKEEERLRKEIQTAHQNRSAPSASVH